MDEHRTGRPGHDLGPDAERRERMVAAIMERARPELERRAASASPLVALTRWIRPALVAAAIVAAAAASLLLVAERGPSESPSGAGFAEMLEVPSPADAWLTPGRGPATSDLIVLWEEGTR